MWIQLTSAEFEQRKFSSINWVGFVQSNERSPEQNSDFRKKEKISPGQPHNHLSELLATNLFIYLYKPAGDYFMCIGYHIFFYM